MGWVTGILVYGVIWWMVFFMTLPVGVRSHDESDDEIVPGTHSSAPVTPAIWRKVLATTVIALVVWGFFYLAVSEDWLDIEGSARKISY